MHIPHPYRYYEGFRAQLARLEQRSPGVTTGDQASPSPTFIALETVGASTLDIARYNRRLRHLDALIADWVSNGKAIRLAEVAYDGHAATLTVSGLPSTTMFVEFEPNKALELDTQPNNWIDGFYVREVSVEGQATAEMTFVCIEPGWRAIDICSYADAMEIGSRIAIARIPIDETVQVSELCRLIEGNTALMRDPALLHALSAATDFLEAALSTRPRSTLQPRR